MDLTTLEQWEDDGLGSMSKEGVNFLYLVFPTSLEISYLAGKYEGTCMLPDFQYGLIQGPLPCRHK